MRKRRILSTVCGMLSVIFCFSAVTFPSYAEEVAGYHERMITETEAVDNWYSVARGVYLASCTAKISDAGRGRVTISGSTSAKSVCDELRMTLYLDESSDNSSYGTIGVYRYSKENAALVSGGESNISVTSGKYYSVRGVHSVFVGDVRETTDTCTDALRAS